MTNTTFSGSPVTLTWNGKVIDKGTINSKKEKPMYKVKTNLLSEYEQGEVITNQQRNKLLQENCPQKWFDKIQVEEGQYWEDSSGTILRVMGRLGSNYVEVLDIQTDIKKDIEKSFLIEVGRKLSDNEIEQALIEEAKRRGYTKDNFKCLIVHTSNSEEDIEYHRGDEEDYLFIGANCSYEKGEWAEIVEQTPDIEINGIKVELEADPHTNHVVVGCVVAENTVFKNLAKYADRYDLQIHRKGEDITDQIRQIAEYYE